MKKPLLIVLSIMASFAFAQDKCLDLCASCMSNDNQSTCSKVEALCKCSDILESLGQELQTTSTTPADTVQKEVSPDTTATTDSTDLQTDTLATADGAEIKDSVAEAPQDTIVSDPVKQPEQATTTIYEQAPAASEDKPKDRTFYLGVSLAFEKFDEYTVADYDVNGGDHDFDNIGANVGFLLRWYMMKSISFQTGLNAVYHHGYSDIKDSELKIGWDTYYYKHYISVQYHSIMAEIPLTLRFGLPYVISPYVSLSVHVRKPLYVWIDYDFDYRWELGEDYYSSRSYDYDDYGSNSGAFTENDWEFLGYLGFGIELTRHLSIQWQMLLINAVTYETKILNYKLLADTWRLNLDIAF